MYFFEKQFHVYKFWHHCQLVWIEFSVVMTNWSHWAIRACKCSCSFERRLLMGFHNCILYALNVFSSHGFWMSQFLPHITCRKRVHPLNNLFSIRNSTSKCLFKLFPECSLGCYNRTAVGLGSKFGERALLSRPLQGRYFFSSVFGVGRVLELRAT